METAVDLNDLLFKCRKWIEYDRDPVTRKEVLDLLIKKDTKTLALLMTRRMEFGPGGIRGPMGAGFSQINEVVIIQAAQGLLKYLSQYFTYLHLQGIVIGYDGRHKSKRFAELAATVFLAASVKTYLFSEPCHTAFVSSSVRETISAAGIMITASQNAKEDNGFKVFLDHGAQPLNNECKEIDNAIFMEVVPRDSSWNVEILKCPLKQDFLKILKPSYNRNLPIKSQFVPKASIVYTPLHGVGWSWAKAAFSAVNFPPLIPVMEQIDIDPDFPTITFPDTESANAFDMAVETANRHKSTYIFVNDHDAGRLGVAEFYNGEWKYFSSNEIGSLLGWWALWGFNNLPKAHEEYDLSKVHFVISTLTSKAVQAMAHAHGMSCTQTLPGFHWVAKEALKLRMSRNTVLFAFEESGGYLCGDGNVYDKDGISAMVKMAELIGYVESVGLTLVTKLAYINDRYGLHYSVRSIFLADDLTSIYRILHRIRNEYYDKNWGYPKKFLGGKYPITNVRDLSMGYDSSTRDKKPTLPACNFNELITFAIQPGFLVTIRHISSETKLRLYAELRCPPKRQGPNNKSIKMCYEVIDAICYELLQPPLRRYLSAKKSMLQSQKKPSANTQIVIKTAPIEETESKKKTDVNKKTDAYKTSETKGRAITKKN